MFRTFSPDNSGLQSVGLKVPAGRDGGEGAGRLDRPPLSFPGWAIRLGETFDAVLIHDAISYMTTEADLLSVFATARAHLRPGGLLIAAPDDYTDTFQPTPRRIPDQPQRRKPKLTYVEYSTDLDPQRHVHRDDVRVLHQTGRQVTVGGWDNPPRA